MRKCTLFPDEIMNDIHKMFEKSNFDLAENKNTMFCTLDYEESNYLENRYFFNTFMKYVEEMAKENDFHCEVIDEKTDINYQSVLMEIVPEKNEYVYVSFIDQKNADCMIISIKK